MTRTRIILLQINGEDGVILTEYDSTNPNVVINTGLGVARLGERKFKITSSSKNPSAKHGTVNELRVVPSSLGAALEWDRLPM